MIKLNKQEYANYITEITWGTFDVYFQGKKRKGTAPFISFNIENEILIGLELTFSKEMFNNLKLNEQINIESYITDITYEDKNGWISLITDKHKCNITKIEQRKIKLNIDVIAEQFEELKISIDTNIEL